MKKIVVRMRGGLGNQLFILAFAYKVVSQLNIDDYEIVLDNREYQNYKIRKFEILELIKDNKIRLYDGQKDKNILYDISIKIYHVVQKILPSNIPIFKFLAKRGFLYSKRKADFLLNTKKDIFYIYGYFQDEKMIKDIRKKILSKTMISSFNLNDINKSGNNIAVSIRCGKDYIEQEWPICSEGYYRQAINEIIERKYNDTDYNVFIFADDMEKAKKMNLSEKAIYVENKLPVEQISMMYYCSDFVISNSSFAWWGAYLGEKEDSIIISPDYWYKNVRTEESLLNYSKMEIRKM